MPPTFIARAALRLLVGSGRSDPHMLWTFPAADLIDHDVS